MRNNAIFRANEIVARDRANDPPCGLILPRISEPPKPPPRSWAFQKGVMAMEHQEYEVRTDVLTDYRTRFPPIRLFDDGSVPTEQLHWKNAHDFDQIARILQNTWTAISSVSRPVARRTPSAVDKR